MATKTKPPRVIKTYAQLETVGDRAPFAKRMRELREEVGATQSQVADALGVSQVTVNDMEAIRILFRRRDLVTIAHLYRMPVSRAFPGVR
jgi:DNA-binding XRE family transcriptional regulator